MFEGRKPQKFYGNLILKHPRNFWSQGETLLRRLTWLRDALLTSSLSAARKMLSLSKPLKRLPFLIKELKDCRVGK